MYRIVYAALLTTGLASTASGQGCDPVAVGMMDATEAISVCVVEDTAYIADRGAGLLRIYDVRHPDEPLPIGEIATTGMWVAVHGSAAYMSHYAQSGLDVIDISRPDEPVLVDTLPLAVAGVEVVGGKLYATAIGSGTDALHVFDLSEPLAPQEVGRVWLPNDPTRFAIDGHYAYLALNAWFVWDLAIVDIQDPSNPTLVSMLPMPNDPQGIDVEDGIAVVGGYVLEDLAVVDVSDPSAPNLLGVHPIGHVGSDIEIKAGKAFVAGREAGLSVFDITDPMSPTLDGHLDTPGHAHWVWLDGSDVYLADLDGGVRVIDARTCLACTPADQAEPLGTMDLVDIVAFLTAVLDGDPAADISEPFGVLDQADINAFIDAFLAGCP